MGLSTLVWVLTLIHTGRTFLTYRSEADRTCRTEACQKVAKRITDAIDETINPCDDFFTYACGKWKKRTELPKDVPAVNRFTEAAQNMEAQMGPLLQGITYRRGDQSLEQKMGILYRTCTGQYSRERENAEIKSLFKKSFSTWPKDVKYDSKSGDSTKLLKQYGFYGLLAITVDIDVHDNTKYAIVMKRPSTYPLGDERLLSLSRQQDKVYRAYISRMIETINPGFKDRTRMAELIHSYEDGLFFRTGLQSDEPIRTTLGNLDKELRSPAIKYKDLIKHFFSNMKVKSPSDKTVVIVESPAYYKTVERSIQEDTPDELYNYLGYKHLSQLIPYSKSDLFFYYTHFLKTVDPTYNKPEDGAFRSHCIKDLMSIMKHAFGRLYVQNFFKKSEERQEVKEIVTHVKEALKTLLNNKDWLEANTKREAQNKVQQMETTIGYPDWLLQPRQVEALFQYVPKLTEGSSSLYLTMVQSVLQNNVRVNLEKLTTSVDKNREWSRDSADTNGEYKPQLNSFILHAGLLQEPVYQYNLPIAVSLGSAGWFGGHELTHGFDTKGRGYDATGKPSNWWTPKDTTGFITRADCFVRQYSGIYDDEAEVHLSGPKNEVENIADNGGMSAVLMALDNILKTTPKADVKLPNLESRSAQALLFLSFANAMCNKMTKPARAYYVENNPHALPMHRVNVALQNHQEFATAFKCASGKKMNPTKKCTLW